MTTKIRLDGGELCLDFTNTVHDRNVSPLEDYLQNYGNLLDWLALTRSLPSNLIGELRKASFLRPDEASRAFALAVQSREVLFQVFSALSHGKKPSGGNLTALNELISGAMQYLRVEYSGGKFQEGWAADTSDLKIALSPIARSSLDLLVSKDFKRLKECPRCSWLFYDSSKNGKRRWCSMETCGSNDKSLRYYYRKKQGD